MASFPTEGEEGNRTVVLAEFSALRAEIAARSSAQHTLLNLNLTASGVVLGAVLAQRAHLAVLLVVPIICCCFGLLFIDHAVVIEKLGSYVTAVLRPALLQHGGGNHFLSWEEHTRSVRTRRIPEFLRFGFPIIVSFSGPSLICSLLVIPALRTWWLWSLWLVAIMLQCVLAYAWIYIVGRWLDLRS